MPELRWLPAALDDLLRLADFVQKHNTDAARTVLRRIRVAADQLQQFPEIGRPMRRGDERREFIVPFGKAAYVLRYRLDARRNSVVIIRVWHSRESRR
jgi:plasmid stabilization system protein ParE